MPTMQEVRAKFPQYDDMSDADLAGALHKKFYADMPLPEFQQKIGFTPPDPLNIDKPVDMAEETGAIGATAGRVLAGAVGAPVDVVNAGLNLFGLGTDAPVGGSRSIQDLMARLTTDAQRPVGGGTDATRQQLGLPPVAERGPVVPGEQIMAAVPRTAAGRVAGRALGEVAAAAVPMAGAFRLGAGAARAAPSTGGAVLDALGGVSNADRAAQVAVSAGAGMGAGVAHEVAPGSPVAEFAGGLLGGGLTGLGLGAAGYLTQAVAPFVSQGARRDVAGATLNRFAAGGAPAANVAPEMVPGSALTTAQASQDSGLAQLERTLRQQPDSAAAFVARDTERAAAQRGAMQELAPQGGGAEDVAAMVRDRLAQFQRRGDVRETLAQNVVDQRARAIGPGLDPVAAGGIVREELGTAEDAAKKTARNLWQQLDARPDLALEVPGTREAATRMLGEITEDTGAPAPFVQAILDRAAEWPDVSRYKNVSDFRKRLTNAQSALQRSAEPTAPTDLRRVNAVLSGLDADIARAAGDVPPVAGGGAAPATPRPSSGGPGPSAGGAVFTPDGQRVETEWRLVDLAGPDAPIVSHTPDFRPNPEFPQALQPRNRDRAASEAQVVKMAGELNPERLGAGGVGDGAPIIGPDRVTESGNGRLLAIDRAYSNGGRRPAEYRAWIEQQGFRTDGMERPALVRVRTNELDDAGRVRFTEAANTGPGLKLSPAEQAAVDARRVSDDTLSLYRGGALDAPDNVDFARAFVKQAAPGDAGTLSTSDGRLSLEGARRMQAAMLAKTYGDAPIVQTLLETGDDDIKALGRALADTAPQMAQLRAAISRGDVPAQFDPVATLTDAARVVQQARKSGTAIGDVLAQSDAFNPTNPHAAAFLGAAYGDGFKRVSYGRATEALRTYADEAMRQTGGDMFGPGPAAGDVWAAAQRRARGIGDDATTAAPGAGGGGAGVPPGGGPVPPAGAGGSGGGAGIVGDGLTPNFGPEDAAQYRAARDATREMKETFGRGAPGQALKSGGFNARGGDGYALPVEQVAGKFFNAGRSSATDMAEFMRAAESRPAAVAALRDYAVGDLRRVAVDDAGRVDPKRWSGWMAKHGTALSAFPDLRREFSNVAAAQRTVERVTSQRQAAVKGFEQSSAGKFLGGTDADIAFRGVMKSGNRTQGLTQLVRMAKGDEAKLGQLRRAAVDDLLRSIENSGAVDGGGMQKLSGAKMHVYMGDYAKPLQKSGLMSPGQVAVLRKVEEDMRREIYVNTVGKVPGSPTYQNFSSAALLGRLAIGVDGQQGAIGNLLGGVLGNTVGRAANFLYQIPDAQVRELITDAMLDPKLARELMARATPDRMQWVLRGMQRRALATGLITATTADGEP